MATASSDNSATAAVGAARSTGEPSKTTAVTAAAPIAPKRHPVRRDRACG
jgi:hypothetical protein